MADEPERRAVAAAGLTYRQIYGTPIWLAMLSLGRAYPNVDLSARVSSGRTTSDLSVVDLAGTMFLYGRDSVFRVGPVVTLGVLSVERVTQERSLSMNYAGIALRMEVDLATTRFAPLLAADAGVVGRSGERSFSSTLAVGGRF